MINNKQWFCHSFLNKGVFNTYLNSSFLCNFYLIMQYIQCTVQIVPPANTERSNIFYSQRELQLEDVQSRLQQDLRERMALDGKLTKLIN